MRRLCPGWSESPQALRISSNFGWITFYDGLCQRAAPLTHGHHLFRQLITTVLDGVTLTPLTRNQYREAGLYPQIGLRSLDALHLAGALDIEASAILTYDIRLTEAARAHGLEVLAPQ